MVSRDTSNGPQKQFQDGNWSINSGKYQKVKSPYPWTSLLSGHLTRSKNFKTPFFKRYWKFLPGGYSNRSRTSPFFFLFQISQQIELLETSKILAEMGRSWQADWATAKIFLSNLHRHVMNKCWKFQEVILILVWAIDFILSA